jgi:hypothetical protein
MRGIHRIAIGSAFLLAGFAASAWGQTLSAPSLSNSSSANEATSSSANPSYQRFSATQTLSSSATSFQTRYYGNASADCGAACSSRNEALSSNYTVSWTATAPNIYSLSIATRRTAGLTIDDEGSNGAQANMGALSCSPSGGTVTGGACTLTDPPDNTAGNSDTDVNVNQTNSLTVCGQSLGSPVNHSVNFQWSQNALTPSTGFLQVNMDSAAVRLGANNLDASNAAADYPGIGSRTQSNDGHFVTVTITNLCGNGVIDSCGANSEQCDQGGLNGTPGSCCTANCTFKAGGTECRGTAGVCDQPEQCTGSSGTCPADTFLPNTTVCRATSAGELCDAPEYCTGGGASCPADGVLPNGTTCRASQGDCDPAEACDGVSKLCPADGKSSAVCRPMAGDCDVAESCDGVNDDCPADQFEPSSVTCRTSAGDCDLAEQCTGSSATCPADAKSSAVCRPTAGVCDVAESCDGVNDDCPADDVEPPTTVCRAGTAGEVCDATEYCDGSGVNCPADAVLPNGSSCRTSAGDCDPTEACDGSSKYCPADAKTPSGTECRAAAGVCDVAEACDGVNDDCPADAFEPATTVCRAVSGGEVCDIAETCTGSSSACPADAVEPSTTECRAAAGTCDIAESCDGTNKTCPADDVEPSGTVCRLASTGEVCDVTETCDGSSPACPADAVLPSGTPCRSSAGDCDPTESCDGSAKVCPSDAKSTAVCRPSAGVCDVAESCNGVDDDCPADANAPDGSSCDDSAFCNGVQTCTGGVCGGGTSPCTGMQTCDENLDVCFAGDCPVAPTTCRSAQKNKVLIKNNADDTKDKLVWKWVKGDATTQADFADPTTMTGDYALCFYAGAPAALLQTANVPGDGTKWSALSDKGYKYTDSTGTASGITKIILKGGDAGKSKAIVKGKGTNLPDFDSDLPIASGDLPLLVQLRNKQTGICWGGSFATAKKNEATQFNAKTP